MRKLLVISLISAFDSYVAHVSSYTPCGYEQKLFAQEIMSKFGDIIRNHGSRNSGDDLLGFQIDIDAYLEESDLFEWIDIKPTRDEDCMLAAKCSLKEGISLSFARDKISDVWERFLRYTEYENHSLEEIPNGFIFHFVTTAPRLGVVGQIECVK